MAKAAHDGPWDNDGWTGPFAAFPRHAALELADMLEAALGAQEDRRTMNRHCDLPVAGRVVREAAVWDPLADVLGPDLVLWRTNLFLGNPKLDWHEDRHAHLLGGGPGASVLVALRDSPPDNCTLMVPGSHRLSPDEKAARYGLVRRDQDGGNIRYGGELPEACFVRVALRAGEAVMFPPTLLHASSGLVGGAAPATARLSLVLRVTTPDATFSPEAYRPTLPRASWPVLARGTRRGAGEAYGPLAG